VTPRPSARSSARPSARPSVLLGALGALGALSALGAPGALARPLAVTIEALKVSPAPKGGGAWDEDGSAPDLQVKVKVGGELLLTSPVLADTYELTVPLAFTLQSHEESVDIFVHDADAERDEKVSAVRVRPRPEDIGAGPRSYRGTNIESLRLSFAPHPAEEEAAAPSAPLGADEPPSEPLADDEIPVLIDPAPDSAPEPDLYMEDDALGDAPEAEPVDPWAGAEGYAPRPSSLPALAPADLSALRLSPAPLADDAARALYREATRLRAEGFALEAKDALVRLIAAHPHTLYALKARRDLF